MHNLNCIKNEKGLTLMEVVASIVILTLIIFSFMMIFIQSAKTNKSSEKIVDATYYAQVEMENIHAMSQEYNFEQREDFMGRLGYATTDDKIFKKTPDKKFYQVALNREDDQLVRVFVQIFADDTSNKLEAQMETLLFWEVAE